MLPESCSGSIVGGIANISERLSIKTKCRFTCTDQDRYKLVGSKIARCTKNSEWKIKGGPPKCTERHSYKKKLRKEQRKKSRRKKKPKLKDNEHSHNGRNKAVEAIMPSTKKLGVGVSTVSYTHLTLPTICSV